MNPRHFKYETWLYGLAFLLALGLRLIQLDTLPLTDGEAGPALQSLHIAQGLKPAISPHPFYILFTATIFFLFGGATDALARLLPALVGSALVFAPLLFQGRIKPRQGVILAFFLALDPGLVTLSRETASSIFAIVFTLFAWGFWNNNRLRLAGAFAALALLGGPSIWAGLLGLGIAWAIRQAMEPRPSGEEEAPAEGEQPAPTTQPPNYKTALIAFVATFLLAGSLLFIAPNGLSAALSSLPAYLRGWGTSSGITSGRLVFSLLVYQPLTLILAILAVLRGWLNGSRRVIRLTLWLMVSLLLAVFYPLHQVNDLAWFLIPLCSLAALELIRHIDVFPDERSEVLGVVVLTGFILVFTWLNLTALTRVVAPSSEFSLRIWLLVGSLLLLTLSLILVGFGWSARIARLGAVWGMTLSLGILSLGGALGSAGLRGAAFPELWPSQPRPAQADLLSATINNLSELDTGSGTAAPVTIVGLDSPTLDWTLRNHSVERVEALDPTASPAFVITQFEVDPSLAAAYRGQDFTWRQTPAWETALFTDWIRWITLREMPQNGETIILWARDNLFLDSNSSQPAP